MLIAVLITCFILIFWLINQKNSRREIVNFITTIGIVVVWAEFFLISNTPKSSFLFLLAIPFLIYCFYYLKIQLEPLPLEIQAIQQNYWELITPNKIIQHFAPRKDYKQKRIDIKINPLQKVWYRKYSNNAVFLTGNFFIEYKNLNLTRINNLKNIYRYFFYRMIFEKLKKIIKDKEISLDFDEILKKNEFCVEYFLMELWEKYTQDINIGVGNLIVEAKRDIERELVGALDNLDLNSVKRNGAALFYSYIEFKNRLPQFELVELDEDEDF